MDGPLDPLNGGRILQWPIRISVLEVPPLVSVTLVTYIYQDIITTLFTVYTQFA